ncbi:MAG: ligase-associated DNA damage response exonuclease [Chloroflexi bacterium]|nr:ligase-associated DNA damage response exonuclease [Chloroflexota bacterium]
MFVPQVSIISGGATPRRIFPLSPQGDPACDTTGVSNLLLLETTERGLYCPRADIYIDPWVPVPRAVVTHAHADHLVPGCGSYLVACDGLLVTRARLGDDASIQTAAYGDTVALNGVEMSLHPAGHILGSAQVRLAHRGAVAVVSGDYRPGSSTTCAPFEPIRCQTFVTESTFALPIFRWAPDAETFAAINTWWATNAAEGRPSLLLGYALGKAQRLLAGVDAAIGPIYTHGAVERLVAAYRASGVVLPPTHPVAAGNRTRNDWAGALIIAPPWAHQSPWARRFGAPATGLASGWMRIRGTRRRRAVDRGFVLSDHADWPGLLEVIAATGAEAVWATHGYAPVLARWLGEQGADVRVLPTRPARGEDAANAEEAAMAAAPRADAPEADA